MALAWADFGLALAFGLLLVLAFALALAMRVRSFLASNNFKVVKKTKIQ